tara:strand:+ start:4051 stop:4512 length:462 start_codon:yes stop_codon:yes gene_type:complete
MNLSFKNYLPTKGEIRLSSSVILINKERKVLLELRKDCSLWGLVGGRVEFGEDPIDTACRECKEETGIIISAMSLNLLGIYGKVSEYRILDFGDNIFHSIDIVYYSILTNNSELVVSNESKDLSFFDIDSINQDKTVKGALRPLAELKKIIEK